LAQSSIKPAPLIPDASLVVENQNTGATRNSKDLQGSSDDVRGRRYVEWFKKRRATAPDAAANQTRIK
jgi:hypothetical protein